MMHYYQFNIGDYFKHTRHLSLLEDLAYRRLLDFCYTNEKPIQKTPKQIARLIGMSDYQNEVSQVLEDFFELGDDGYFQNRIKLEIEKYHSKADSARVNGRKGGRPKKPETNPDETESKPKKTQSVNLANPTETGSKANQEPITNNHINNNTSFTNDFLQSISDSWNTELNGISPNIDLTRKTKINEKRLRRIKAIVKDYPDYIDPEYWQGHISMLAILPDLQWQRENRQLTFDQAIQADKFERNLGLMKMEVSR